MKLIGMTALAALALGSCGKPPVAERTPAPPPASTSAATPAPFAVPESVALATPAPPVTTPMPEPIAAVPPPPEPAPPGVFYMLAPTRIETADGFHGLPAGTTVKLVRKGVYLTPYGEAVLESWQVTDDLVEARAAYDVERANERVTAEEAIMAAAARDAAAPRAPATKSEAALQRAELRRQEALIYIELDRIRAELSGLSSDHANHAPAAARLNARHDQLREQLRQVVEQSALIPR